MHTHLGGVLRQRWLVGLEFVEYPFVDGIGVECEKMVIGVGRCVDKIVWWADVGGDVSVQSTHANVGKLVFTI